MASIVKAPAPAITARKGSSARDLGRLASQLKPGQAIKLDGSSRGPAAMTALALSGYSGKEYRTYKATDGAYYLRNGH